MSEKKIINEKRNLIILRMLTLRSSPGTSTTLLARKAAAAAIKIAVP
jgi:hypothetical protein